MAGHQLAMNPGDADGAARRGVPTTEPAFGLPAVWIREAGRAEAEALGYTVVDAESVVVTHLTEMIRAHAAELLSRQDDAPAARSASRSSTRPSSSEVVPDLLSVGEVQRVLQSLLARGRVDPRPGHDPGGDRRQGAPHARPGDAGRVRPPGARPHDHRAVPRRRAARCARSRSTRSLEQTMAEALTHTADGEFLAMDPNLAAHGRRLRGRAGRAGAGRRRPPGAAVLGRACAATCACCASSACRRWRSARTTRSLRVSV